MIHTYKQSFLLSFTPNPFYILITSVVLWCCLDFWHVLGLLDWLVGKCMVCSRGSAAAHVMFSGQDWQCSVYPSAESSQKHCRTAQKDTWHTVTVTWWLLDLNHPSQTDLPTSNMHYPSNQTLLCISESMESSYVRKHGFQRQVNAGNGTNWANWPRLAPPKRPVPKTWIAWWHNMICFGQVE